MSISARVRRVKPSLTLAVTAKAKALQASGVDVISFGAGEPDFDTPPNIKQAGISAIERGETRYTASSGTPELKKAIQQKFLRENKLEYSLKEIIVSAGAKHSLYNIFQAIIDPGDEVIIPAPYWVSYPDMLLLADGVPVIVPTLQENNFELTLADLKKYCNSKTKAIIINSPANPTGAVYTSEKLQAIAQFLEAKNIYIISDEIYEHFLYDNKQFYSIAQYSEKIKSKTLVVNGVSKAYAMTGWRIGYCAGPEDVIQAMDVIQSQSLSNPTSIAQVATIQALTGEQSSVTKMRDAFAERRNYMVEALNAIPGVTCQSPAGAFYAFPNVQSFYGQSYNGKKITNSLEFADLLLKESHVAVVPGAGFGADRYVRLSYACSLELIKTGVARLAAFCQALS